MTIEASLNFLMLSCNTNGVKQELELRWPAELCALYSQAAAKYLITVGQFTSSTGKRSDTGHCVRRVCVSKCQVDTNAWADRHGLN